MKRTIFLIFTTLFCSTILWAESIKFTASAPNIVEVGEQFRLGFSVNKKGKNIVLPKLADFDILMGPSTSSSMSTQIINGKVTTTSSYTYTYVLVAKKEGKFTIDPAEITVDGKKQKSNALTIEVVKGSSQTKTSPSQQPQSTTTQRITQENIFVKVDVSRRSVYLGENIVATIKVYTKLPISGFGDSKFPSFNGFLSQEIPTANQITMQRENVNGTIYNTGIIRKLLLFPQHTGEITIDPFELECIVRQRRNTRSQSFFDDFFDNYQDIRVPRRSKPVKIWVKELPSNAPSGFQGAVGQFRIQTSIDKDSVKINDAITLKVKVSGNGNLKLINPLSFNIPADFEIYDPKTSYNLNSTPQGMTGSTSFEYLLIPRHAGNFTIPSANFVYFDLQANRYKRLRTPSFNIQVTKDKNSEGSGIVSSFSKEDVKFIGKDIRYIKINEFTPRIKGEVFFGTVKFYMGYLVPFAIFLLAFAFNRKRIRENSDIVRMKNKRANRKAMKHLKAAALSLKANQREQFYNDILKALWGYTSDKLNLPLANLNKENITEILLGKNITQELIDEFVDILNTCEFARYAPAIDSTEMNQIYQKTEEVITKLEKNIK